MDIHEQGMELAINEARGAQEWATAHCSASGSALTCCLRGRETEWNGGVASFSDDAITKGTF